MLPDIPPNTIRDKFGAITRVGDHVIFIDRQHPHTCELSMGIIVKINQKTVRIENIIIKQKKDVRKKSCEFMKIKASDATFKILSMSVT